MKKLILLITLLLLISCSNGKWYKYKEIKCRGDVASKTLVGQIYLTETLIKIKSYTNEKGRYKHDVYALEENGWKYATEWSHDFYNYQLKRAGYTNEI